MYKAINANKRNTLVIMTVFVGLVGAIGWLVGTINGNPSVAYAVIASAIIYALLQFFIADKLAVAATGATEIQKSDNPRLWRLVENLSITTGLPMPKVYLIDDQAPNAFATGRDPSHATVAATSGLMDIMNDRQLEAVLAHEIGHVKNYDIRVGMITFGLVSAIGMLSDFALRTFFFGRNDNNNNSPIAMIVGLVLIVLAPFIALIIQMAVSRQREYLADATSAITTRDPEGLAQALEKLMEFGRPLKKQSSSTAHLFFDNPLKQGTLSNLFSTHPPLEDRIARLRGDMNKW